jgi:hypothetical protein
MASTGYHYIEDVDNDADNSAAEPLVHTTHDDDQDQESQARNMLEALTQNVEQDAQIDLTGDLNIGSSNRASTGQEVVEDDDPNSQSLFFDHPSDATSSLRDRVHRGSSEGSFARGAGRNDSRRANASVVSSVNGEPRASPANSIKSEEKKPERQELDAQLDQAIIDGDEDDDDVVFTGVNAISMVGAGSANDPMTLDD